jgi:hypothetical protein
VKISAVLGASDTLQLQRLRNGTIILNIFAAATAAKG